MLLPVWSGLASLLLRVIRMTNRSKLISPRALARGLGIPMATLWRWTLNGVIPMPIFRNARVMGWNRQVIERWLGHVYVLIRAWGSAK